MCLGWSTSPPWYLSVLTGWNSHLIFRRKKVIRQKSSRRKQVWIFFNFFFFFLEFGWGFLSGYELFWTLPKNTETLLWVALAIYQHLPLPSLFTDIWFLTEPVLTWVLLVVLQLGQQIGWIFFVSEDLKTTSRQAFLLPMQLLWHIQQLVFWKSTHSHGQYFVNNGDNF